ncbi:MAG TPA: hypothetical protein PKJ56_10150, partial [Promineifilum sp.]|nr:hypothetical protein [Promineifilum sp.]
MNQQLPKRLLVFLVSLLVLAGVLSATTPQAAAANPAPVQVFYLTEPEADMLPAMKIISSTAASPMVTKISIAISQNNTIVYYDHWENGFVADIANPTPGQIYSSSNTSGVQIWGNGKAADGCAPALQTGSVTCTDANDKLNAGDVIILSDSAIPVPRGTSIHWDGKDKIAASKAVAVSRSLWASGSNSLFAWAMTHYPTSDWGTLYTAPVGCNTSGMDDMFEYTAFSITAAYNNTRIQVDPEGDGTFQGTVTLQEGRTYFID